MMIALVFVGLQSMAEIQNRLEKIIENNNVKTSLVTAMRYAARERTMTLYRMVTLDDPFERDEEFLRFNSHGAAFANARMALLKMDLSGEEKSLLEKQAKLTGATVDSQNDIVDLAIGEESEQAIEILFEITVPAQEAVFAVLTELLNIQKRETELSAKVSAEKYENAWMLMLLFSGVAVLIGIAVAVIVTRYTQKTEKTLYIEKEKAQVTLHSIGEGVITTDADGNIDYLNPVAEKMTGWTDSNAKGLPLLEVFCLVDGNGNPIKDNLLDKVLNETSLVSSTHHYLYNKKENESYALEHTAGPMRDYRDRIIGSALVFRNVTDIRDMALQMSFQATHDALTGLINRTEFEKRLELALTGARQKKKVHVLCYMDLDQFKVVNDTCGHVAGDELLKQLVTILSTRLRSTDTLARLGGDEFGLLFLDCTIEQAMDIAESMREKINDFRFSWEDKSFVVGASFGLVAITPESGTITDLLSAADSACYVAKDLGRDRIHIYQQDDKELAQRQGEMQWLPRIREALENNRFSCYCQRILPLGQAGKGSERYEILVRMKDEEGGIVPPMAFIPAAERYHLMPNIDRWVIQSVFSFLHKYQKNNSDVPQSWAINLSGQSICDDDFLNFIVAQIKDSGIDPSIICFEVTETAAVKNLSRATEFITILKKLGCRFSLDDFGSGLSSFTYLKNLPVDYLKIDGSFVKDMLEDEIDFAMVKSINQIGHTMGLQTIAEFVENEDALEKLRLIRVDYGQGYGIHVPQPLDDLLKEEHLLERKKA